MADTKISALTSGAPALATDEYVVARSGANRKLTLAQILTAPALDSPSTANYLRFPATQSASAGANDLDDYEEGTFTGTVSFGGAAVGVTYAANGQLGVYTKIGNQVPFALRIALSAKGSSTGAFRSEGLPFTSIGTTGYSNSMAVRVNTLTSITGMVQALLNPSDTGISLAQLGTGSSTNLTDTNINNTSSFVISGVYTTT